MKSSRGAARTRTAALCTTLGLSLAVSACGFSGDSGSEGGGGTTIDLLVPQYSDNTKSLWQGIISDFESENPDVDVNFEIQSWDNINDVVRTKVQANDAPDILNIDAFASFAADGLLYPAADVLSQDTLADFQESFAENASVDGEMMGMPLIASSRTLFANTDLMKQAGVTEMPATWEDLLAAAKKISALGGGVYGYGMPLGNEEAQAETSIWVFGNGGDWGDESELTIETPENVEAVEFMQKMIDDGATQPDPGATDRTPLINVFVQGKIGFIEALPPTVAQIETEHPKLNYELAPIPTNDGSSVTLGVADHLMAFKNDGDKQDAIRSFLDYFYSTDVYTNFVTTENFLPVTQSAAEQMNNPDLQVFLEALPDAKFYPSTNPAWAEAQGAIQTLIGQIGQGKPADEVMSQIAGKVEGS
ncbi:MAG TPA: extracellular solute-binding protein [Nocardioidaceae bacterium]|nr:extracellular solute-binding protein [Nocardioidaceae bacterium]